HDICKSFGKWHISEHICRGQETKSQQYLSDSRIVIVPILFGSYQYYIFGGYVGTYIKIMPTPRSHTGDIIIIPGICLCIAIPCSGRQVITMERRKPSLRIE